MDIINEYFRKKSKEISFFEAKEEARIQIPGYPTDRHLPLPIMTKKLVKGVEGGELEEEIKISYIIEGIIFLIGTDEEFPNIDAYKNILKTMGKDLKEYIFYEGIKLIEKKDYDSGAIYFRTLKLIDGENIDGLFNYALALEEIAKSFLDEEREEEGINFLQTSTRELESILDIDDKYPLAYYKLGYHYKFFGQFLKAKLIWTKYLVLDRDDLRLQEIRTELDLIEDDVTLESGVTYLSHEQYDNALNMFLKLLPRFNRWWELNYFIGIAYRELGDHEKSVEHFQTAIESSDAGPDVYNELGISLFNLGDINRAVEIFSQGIDKTSADYKLLFNRGLGYLQLNKLQESYRDIEEATMINPNDDNMNKQKKIIEELLGII